MRRFHNRKPRNIPTQSPRIAIEKPSPAMEPAVYLALRYRTPGPLPTEPPDPPVGWLDADATCKEWRRILAT